MKTIVQLESKESLQQLAWGAEVLCCRLKGSENKAEWRKWAQNNVSYRMHAFGK